MNKGRQFGETVEGYNIPVLNEREIRASAGILFLFLFISWMLIVGRLIVSRQNPEYVGAVQKKFAWTIGLVLATIMFFLMVVVNSYSFITGIICLICLTFLFFESVFGICLGCLFYHWFNKEKMQYCPGEICDVKARQEIQKTSFLQIGIVIGFYKRKKIVSPSN